MKHAQANAKLQEQNVDDLTQSIKQFTNPFAGESDQVITMVTKAVVSEKIQQDINSSTEVGAEKFAQFVKEMITREQVNLWAPMKKQKLQMWSSAGMKAKLKNGDQVVELKTGHSLLAS